MWKFSRGFCSYHIRQCYTHVNGKDYPRDKWTNITKKVIRLANGDKLLMKPHHPHSLLKQRITSHFNVNYRNNKSPIFTVVDNLNSVVTPFDNFDRLLIGPDHPSRNPSDTYYLNEHFILRTHTTIHEHDLIQSGLDSFLTFGDVYRRDAVDSTHFPVFHQVEGVRLYNYPSNLENELKNTLEKLLLDIFGQNTKCHWKDDFFPFTDPSWELSLELDSGELIEICGCGILRPEIISNAGAGHKFGGWAFGIGIDRLAMKLYGIDDIRLFWSDDDRFSRQFRTLDFTKSIKFKPFSRHPACIFDMSFWLNSDEEMNEFSEAEFFDLSRSLSNEKIEKIERVDVFKHPQSGRLSYCYRFHYRDMYRVMSDEQVRGIHKSIEEEATKLFRIEIR